MARTDYALFTVDTATFEVKRYTKGYGLSEVNPTALAYDEERQQWIVGYANGSLDFRDSWGTTNLPDFRISQVTGDKTINAITIEDQRAYLATNIGVVVVDLMRREIADTWPLSAGGESTEAQCVFLNDNQWLVGTNLGILSASKDNPFLSNAENWNLWSADPGLGSAFERSACRQVVARNRHKGSSDVVVWRGDDSGFWEVMPG